MNIFENIKPEDIKVLDAPPGSESPETPEASVENQEAEEEQEEGAAGDEEDDHGDDQGQEGDESDDQGDDEEFEITEDIANDIVSQRFGMSSEEIEGKLQRLEELEAGEMQFKSGKHQKAYEFLANYAGDDYEGGIIRYARIQSANIGNMTPEQAMKELYIQKNADLSIEDATAVWEAEHSAKYSDLDDPVTKIKFNQEGRQALNELAQLKEKFEAKEEETPDIESEAAEIAQARQGFLSSVDSSLENYSEIEMELDGEPESAFSFKLSDMQSLKECMSDVETFYKAQEWITPDGKMNPEKMKIDMAFLLNKEAILEQYYRHGKNVSKEQMLAEINNSTGKGKREAPPAPRTGPLSLNERLAQARPIGQ